MGLKELIKSGIKVIAILFVLFIVFCVVLAIVAPPQHNDTKQSGDVTPTATEDPKEEALKLAKGNVSMHSGDDMRGVSEQEIRDNLKNYGFKQDEIDYAIKNITVNYKEQCAKTAQKYSKIYTNGVNEKVMREDLKKDGFRSEEIDYAIDKIKDKLR